MLQEILKPQGYTTLGVTGCGYLDKKYGFKRGFMEYYDRKVSMKTASNKLVGFVKEYLLTRSHIFAFFSHI